MTCYAAYAKNEDIRKSGSSGGIFPMISKKYISIGWVIYASIYDENLNVVFSRIDNPDNLNKTFTSKYMQSEVGHAFKNIASDIKSGRKVLFCGTPCQALGLKKYLCSKNISNENLIIIDFICHGVPSSKVFQRSINDQYSAKLTSLNMRNKDLGWNYGNFSWKILLSDGTNQTIKQSDVPYMKGFLSNIYLRPSCYSCVAKSNVASDITLGDFWGISEINKNIDTKYGVSCVLLRTLKGENAL